MRKTDVKPAAPNDIPGAARVAAARSVTGWNEKTLAGELGREDSLFFVAAEDGAILGYAVARLVGDECRLLDIAVEMDGAGVGRVLWAFLVGVAKRRGAVKMTLEVSERNTRAREFYRAAGAKETGRRPTFYADGAGAVLMDLPVTNDNH